MKKINKTERIIDFFKTALIYALTISMLYVAGLYINARQNYGQTEEIPLEKRRIFGKGGIIDAVMDENHVNPVQITVTAENKSVTSIYNDMLISIVYEDFKNAVSALFKLSECIRLDKTEGEKIWKKCAGKENSVYIRYAGNYIYPVLCAFLDESDEMAAITAALAASDASTTSAGDLAEVHELFIVDEDPVYGVAKDSNGNIAVFSPNEYLKKIIRHQISTHNLQAAYNKSAGGIPCKFLKDGDIRSETGINRNNIENLIFAEDFHLFYNYYNYNTSAVLSFLNPLLAYNDDINDTDETNNINKTNKIDIEKTYIKSLFGIFNFNAESAGHYPDSNSETFRDRQSTMKFVSDGQITYSYKPSDIYNITDKGGVHLSRFLWTDADSYTFYEKLTAASAFVNGLSKELAGGEANLYLKDIKIGENQNLNITFSYYYNGTEININRHDYGIFISMNDNSITDVIINSLYVASEPKIKNINPMLILSGFDGMISEELKSLQDTESIENMGNIENIENPEDKNKGKAEIAGKYKIKYDNNQDKFIVNRIELIYNINYSDGGNPVQAEWIIR